MHVVFVQLSTFMVLDVCFRVRADNVQVVMVNVNSSSSKRYNRTGQVGSRFNSIQFNSILFVVPEALHDYSFVATQLHDLDHGQLLHDHD